MTKCYNDKMLAVLRQLTNMFYVHFTTLQKPLWHCSLEQYCESFGSAHAKFQQFSLLILRLVG